MPKLDRHSKIVGLLKVVLPLVGLTLLATLFMVARRVDPQSAIPYAQVDVDELVRNPRITAPAYAGVTADGAQIALQATSARPASQMQAATAMDVTAKMALPDGSQLDLQSQEAEIATQEGQLRLKNGVQIMASSGYQIKAPGLIVGLDVGSVQSTGIGIEAISPMGRLEAESFALQTQQADLPERAENSEQGYLLVFSGRVKLLYQPDS